MKFKLENYNQMFILLGFFFSFGLPAEISGDWFIKTWDFFFARKIYYRLTSDINYYDLRLKDVYSEFNPENNVIEIAIREKGMKEV